MESASYKPGPPLSAFVDRFWYLSGATPDSKCRTALPTGRVDLTFNLLDERLRVFTDVNDATGSWFTGAVVHGAHSRYFVIDAKPELRVLGVHFQVCGGAVVLGVPAVELTDRHFALEDLWGARARTLREQLADQPTPQAMFALLEREFLARLNLSPLVHPAVSFALRRIRPTEPVPIATLQEQTGYSARRFATLFETSVGLTPKLYSRVVRLRSVIEKAARQERPEWAALAAEHGFYDQSHLNREFREITGFTPGTYKPMSGEEAMHMEIEKPGDKQP